MKRSTQILAVVVAILGGISVIGCSIDPDFDLFEDFDLAGSCSGTTPDLNGIWEFTGTGERTECRDDFLNTKKFEISSLEIPLDYDETTGELTLGANDFGSNFEIKSASVDRACVEFTTVERVGDQTIEYRWKGRASNAQYMEGDFTGTGPSGCVATGDFTMSK